MSLPGLVGMPELDVCQHFSDKLGPNCPDQDDISVWSNADGLQPQDLPSMRWPSTRSLPRGLGFRRRERPIVAAVRREIESTRRRSSPTDERGGGESRGCGQTRQHAQGIPVTLRIRTCRICRVDTVFDPSGAHVNSVESDSAVRCKHGELESSRGQVSSLLVRRGIEIPSRLWIEASDGLTCRSARGAPPQRPPVVRSLRPALQPGAQRRIGGVRPAGR